MSAGREGCLPGPESFLGASRRASAGREGCLPGPESFLGASRVDYPRGQPFPQLGREVCTLAPAGRVLTRFRGRVAPTGRVPGLERRGWRPGDAGADGGRE